MPKNENVENKNKSEGENVRLRVRALKFLTIICWRLKASNISTLVPFLFSTLLLFDIIAFRHFSFDQSWENRKQAYMSKLKVEFNYSTIASTIQLFNYSTIQLFNYSTIQLQLFNYSTIQLQLFNYSTIQL